METSILSTQGWNRLLFFFSRPQLLISLCLALSWQQFKIPQDLILLIRSWGSPMMSFPIVLKWDFFLSPWHSCHYNFSLQNWNKLSWAKKLFKVQKCETASSFIWVLLGALKHLQIKPKIRSDWPFHYKSHLAQFILHMVYSDLARGYIKSNAIITIMLAIVLKVNNTWCCPHYFPSKLTN